MMKESLETELRSALEKTAGRELDSIGLDDDLVIELDLDSLAALRMLAAVEKHFGVRFPDAQLSEFRTLRCLLDFVKSEKE